MAEVIKTLTKYYGEMVEYEPAIGQLIYSGKLDLKNDFTQVLSTVADAASLKIDSRENIIHLSFNP